MRDSYPVIIGKGDEDYLFVDIPDFGVSTQGRNISDAIDMAMDAIGLAGTCLEDRGETIPKASDIRDVKGEEDGDIVTLVMVDFTAYRRMHDWRAVKKNCTIPSWLNAASEKAGVNFSTVLQEGLKRELGIDV